MAVTDVSPADAAELLDRGAFLLDVREPVEWEAGHAPDAHHVPLADLPDEVDGLPRDVVIVCACRSGGRSLRAATFLAERGFEAVNLAGGMLAWVAEDRPFVADGAAPSIS